MIKLIVFDWDDVFTVGAKEGYFKCYHQAMMGVGIKLDLKEEKKRIMAKWGQPYREEIKELLKENLDLVDEACRIFEREYWGNTFVDSLTLVKRVGKTLPKLKEKYVLAVATGNHHEMLKNRIIPSFNIPNVFSQIISVHQLDDPTKGKPHPHMLEVLMKNNKVQPNETVFLGDAENDVLMARNADVEPIVVLTGLLNKNQAKKLGVKYIIDNVTQIEKVINLINKNLKAK